MTMIEQRVVELFDIIFDSDMILGFWNNDSDSDIILFTLV